MKRAYSLAFCIFSFFSSTSQNTGIGTATPVQTLDVNGAIKIGNSANNQAGSIRYNSGNFEGGDGTSWKNIGLPSKAIILSQAADTAALKAEGFSVLRQMDNWDTAYLPVSTNYPGGWVNGFPLSSSAVTPAPINSAETIMYNNNFIYFGSDAYLYEYDITAQVWVKLPNICPLGVRQSSGLTLVGNEIYVTGGWAFPVVYNTCAKYNLLTNSWTNIASMPVTNTYHATAAIGTDIYILDGASTYSSGLNFQKKMYRYNTVSNTWSADLSTATTPDYQYGGAIVSWNNKLVYHIGDMRVAAYDPVAQTNTVLNPAVTTMSFYSFVIALASNKLYIAGSIPDTTNIVNAPNTYIPVHYEVDLNTGTTTQLNVCQLNGKQVYSYKYNVAGDKFYGLNESFAPVIFNRSAADACNLLIRRKAYWYYLKKN